MADFQTGKLLEGLYAQKLGEELLRWVKAYDPQRLAAEVNTEALSLIREIQGILDDQRLDDPECFHRVEAIVAAFDRAGIPTARHDW